MKQSTVTIRQLIVPTTREDDGSSVISTNTILAPPTSEDTVTKEIQDLQPIEQGDSTGASVVDSIQAFAKGRKNVHIHLRMDNTSALSYVTRMGGTQSTRLTEVACQIWDWCLQRQITLSASHLPGLEKLGGRPRIPTSTDFHRMETPQGNI